MPEVGEWISTAYIPEWADGYKRVEMRKVGQEAVPGKLVLDDTLFDGDDEIPLFIFQDNAGERHSFHDYDEWRLIRFP